MGGDLAAVAPPTGRQPTFRLPRWWYAACLGGQLRRRPVARTVHGVPLVIFRRADGRPAALLDRCPHRNVPLSLGAVEAGAVRCAYHGWCFDDEGHCRDVPGLGAEADVVGRRVPAFPTLERHGVVWVVPSLEAPVTAGPAVVPHVDLEGRPLDGFHVVRRSAVLAAPVLLAVENALDVAHTTHLHGGLFRGQGEAPPVAAGVHHGAGFVEVTYEPEARPRGLAGRLLAPGGGVVDHVDRFVLPSTTEVEYRLGDERLVVTTAFTPVDEATTALHATVAFKSRAPAALVRALVGPVADRILRQDARILRAQAATVARFGGERFTSTAVDVLTPHVHRLVQQAERTPAAVPPPGGGRGAVLPAPR